MISNQALHAVVTPASTAPAQPSQPQPENPRGEFADTFEGAGHSPTSGQRPSGTRVALTVNGDATVNIVLTTGSDDSRMWELRSGAPAQVVNDPGRLTTCDPNAVPNCATGTATANAKADTQRLQSPIDKIGEGVPLRISSLSKQEVKSLPPQTLSVLDWLGSEMIGSACGDEIVVKAGTIVKRGKGPADEKMPETLLKAAHPDTDLIKPLAAMAKMGPAPWNATFNHYVTNIINALKPYIEAQVMSAYVGMLGALRDEDKLLTLRSILSDEQHGGMKMVRYCTDELEAIFPEHQQGDLKQLLRECKVIE